MHSTRGSLQLQGCVLHIRFVYIAVAVRAAVVVVVVVVVHIYCICLLATCWAHSLTHIECRRRCRRWRWMWIWSWRQLTSVRRWQLHWQLTGHWVAETITFTPLTRKVKWPTYVLTHFGQACRLAGRTQCPQWPQRRQWRCQIKVKFVAYGCQPSVAINMVLRAATCRIDPAPKNQSWT